MESRPSTSLTGPDARSRRVLTALFFVSGASGLIYEITWSRMLVFVFGGTTFAISTVLGCFMGGLALGSLLGGRLGHRIRRPSRLYGVLELAIGVVCLILPFLFDAAVPVYRAIARLSGDSFLWLTVGRVLVSALLLLVPTTLMGATLPLLCQAFVGRTGELGSVVARLYGINTLGAFVGTVGTGFLLLPTLGISRSIALAATLNIAAGLTVLVLERRNAPGAAAGRPRVAAAGDPVVEAETVPFPPALLLWLFGLSGFVAMAYQVAWTRALIPSMGASTYAFSSIVACFIFGLGLGSLLVPAWIRRMRSALLVAGALELTIGLSALVVAPLFGRMPGFVARLSGQSGAGFERIMTLEFLAVLGLLIVPTLCMGALLPIVCVLYRSAGAPAADSRRADGDAHDAGRSVGIVYAANTIGTILGATVAGFVLIPADVIGTQRTILLASALSGLIGTTFLIHASAGRRRVVRPALVACWIVGLLGGTLMQPWSREALVSAPYLARRTDPGEVLFYHEGIDTTVAVTSRGGDRVLRVNGKPDASTFRVDMTTQVLFGLLPMLLRPEAKDVSIVGLGSGITVGAVLAHPVESVEVAEISRGVIRAARFFDTANNGALDDPRLTVHRADGRNHLLLTDRKYDLIISEPSNPWLSGVANLFSGDFLDIARSRLKPGGLHCQWIHAYSLKAGDFAAVLKTMADRFDHIQVWQMELADYLIVGSMEPIVLDLEEIHFTKQRPVVASMFGVLGLNDPLQLAHHYIADGPDLEAWTGDESPLTDDVPRLEFSAPRYLLRDEEAEISRRLNEAGALPTLVGEPEGWLNRRFLSTARRARRARAAFREATLARRRGDWGALADYREAAVAAFDDVRLCHKIDTDYTRMLAGQDETIRSRIEVSHEEIAGLVPCIRTLRDTPPAEAILFDWPLGSRTPSQPSDEVRAVVRRGAELIDSGRLAEAARLAQEAAERFPDDPLVLGSAGVWTLAAEGPEAATPYLLRVWLLAPGHAESNYHLARAYALRDRPSRSLFFLEAAVEAGFASRARIEQSELQQQLGTVPRYRTLLDRLGAP